MQLTKWVLDHPEYGPLETEAPFSLYQTLLDHGKMKDPFYRENEKEATKLCEKNYSFHTEFFVTDEDFAKTYQVLKMEGVDTLCTVRLNGSYVAHLDNMHRTWQLDVKPYIKRGQNRLDLCFESPINYIYEQQHRHYTWGTSNAMEGFGHIRKAHCMYGWDWGPHLPDMGVFRPVSLLSYDHDRLDDVLIRQVFKEDGTVTLNLSASTMHHDPQVSASVSLKDPQGTVIGEVSLTPSEKHNGRLEGTLTVEKPQLWWPHGYGSQPLYTVTTTLHFGQQVLETNVKRIGLRTMDVSTAKDQWGHEFCFVVNGKKIFAMGADYIPEDNILPHVTYERTRRLIKDCADANFNCIRVWGGGLYPRDDFFDLCDEFGMVVWEDCMFACVNVRLSKPFTESIVEELKDNIKRIRHHASLGLICGNNEMELGVTQWPEASLGELAKMDYLQLYEHIIPDICDEYAPDTFYWPSSPSSGGGFINPSDENSGDVHYWGAWHGGIPFESYRQYYFRFLSEFGFESFPNMKTIRAYAEEADMNPFSNVMEAHQKCPSGNSKILTYLADHYRYPFTFETLVYASQLLQLDAIRLGVEHYRRFRGRCMGAIYWQLNDCWPTDSWASVDYYGRWKALMYGSKRFFAPVLLSAHETGLKVVLNVSNETVCDICGTVEYTVIDRDFNEYEKGSFPYRLNALSALDVASLDLTGSVGGHERERLLTFRLLDEKGEEISHSSLMLCKPKEFEFTDPDIKVSVEKTQSGGEGSTFLLHVSASAYAKYVCLDLKNLDWKLSDNYFDITSSREVTLTASMDNKDITTQDLLKEMTVMSVRDIG